MKRSLCGLLLLAAAFAVPASAQDAGSARKEGVQTTAKADKQKGREGADCDTNRAGVRCTRPKPKKVWFFGKA